MNQDYEWEPPLFDEGYIRHQQSHQDSTSPPSTLTRTPVGVYLPTVYWDSKTPDMSEFSAPITFNWVDYYADILCFLWFREDSSIQSVPSCQPGYLTPPSKSSTTRSRPTLAFQCFVQKVISATAVSQAVLVLSLWYIERLRSKNVAAIASPGSEYRLCATGMMLANKYLDDNTYTSKTWSSMTGIPLNEMNLMEIEFLASLNHSVGISDEAYLSWLDVLGSVAMTAAYARYSVYQPIAPSDYPFTFESSYLAPSYECPQPIRHRGRSKSSEPHRRPSKSGAHEMPFLQQAIKTIEIETGSSESSSPLALSAPRKRTAAQVFSAGHDRAVRRIKSTQGTQRRNTAQRLFAGNTRASSAVNGSHLAIESSETKPPPSAVSYQLMPALSMSGTNYSMPDDPAGSGMSMHQGSGKEGYLQLPYDYWLGYQPRQEDLTFYTVAASPIEDEYLPQHDDHATKVGKMRVPNHGQYLPSYQQGYQQTMPNQQYGGYAPQQAPISAPYTYWRTDMQGPRRLSASNLYDIQPQYIDPSCQYGAGSFVQY